MVPLELPLIDPKKPLATSVADGVTQANDLTEEEQKKLEAVGWRMLNLPLIVCHSANGMPFFFPLQKVPHLSCIIQAHIHCNCISLFKPDRELNVAATAGFTQAAVRNALFIAACQA